jgi:cold shock CspA family protein
MRFEGTLVKWNDDRGYGFIAPNQKGAEIFVHISAFPKDSRRPRHGELLSFEVVINDKGMSRASDVRFVGDHPEPPSRTRRSGRLRSLGRMVPLAIIVVLALYGVSEYAQHNSPQGAVAAGAILHRTAPAH